MLSTPPAYSETFFNNKIKGLQKSGIDIYLFVQNNPNNYRLCPVIVAPTVPKGIIQRGFNSMVILLGMLPYFKRVIRFVKLEKKINRSLAQISKNIYNNDHLLKADLDWVHFGFATMALQSENVAQAIGAKMGVSCRGFDLDVYPLKNPNCYNDLWDKVDKLHPISQYMFSKACQLGYPNNKPYQIITPAVDKEGRNNMCKVSSDILQFLTVARLHWIKGLEETLEALARVKESGVNFQYKIIGSGELIQPLRFAVHQLGLTNYVDLVGKLSHERTIEHLNCSDIYIQYSHSEGFCNAVLEAQAAGCLCVVSNGGALSENVLEGKTGWVVPKRNPKLLADKILEILKMPESQKNKIRENAYIRVREKFNLEKQRLEFLEFYE
ncbi:glycosyltransferase family 4 protein [Mangrovimonas aestuarii]|uniref:glycosyltransferase family 4 protein n=1 Tax=Mangrovimonas aestuarii TaxID=3018443 RepID=UPI002378D4A2|nr:glycosyltransferase family 4 protein [Mangrovimonas aestuarii]